MTLKYIYTKGQYSHSVNVPVFLSGQTQTDHLSAISALEERKTEQTLSGCSPECHWLPSITLTRLCGVKPLALLVHHDWQWRKNKQPWIMIIGWSAPAEVPQWRHAQLINCSAESFFFFFFYNRHNNNPLTDGNHFP